eukprot:CAMPEP_0169482190 /NCGR_PEP_ID=MMETSP1042-20121227/30543_1 /TAXON_ID=464988 /ORGANISM="Hemiselmis andersenii, Strain CCMP1180" /LENGTH=38 /DNA_ID= /DNA_START= /DNA_END= /DNA_ORIENTATION=
MTTRSRQDTCMMEAGDSTPARNEGRHSTSIPTHDTPSP